MSNVLHIYRCDYDQCPKEVQVYSYKTTCPRKNEIVISQQLLPLMRHKYVFLQKYIYMNNAQKCKCIFIQNSLREGHMSIKIHFGQQMFPRNKANI